MHAALYAESREAGRRLGFGIVEGGGEIRDWHELRTHECGAENNLMIGREVQSLDPHLAQQLLRAKQEAE